MDKWFANMVAGAVLSALLVLFGANTFINILYPTGGSPEAPPAQEAGTTTADAGGQQEAEPEPQISFASLMSTAEASAGEGQFRKCAACHSIEEGGQNKIGPALYGIVGRQVASVDGFSYSSALQEYGGEWTYERLDCFLENPSECVPGNKMSFAGVKDNEDRADIIAYLKAQTPNPPPLPEPTEAASESGDAAAGDAETTDAPAASDDGADASAGDGSGEAASADPASKADTASEEAAADEAAAEETASKDVASATDGGATADAGGEAGQQEAETEPQVSLASLLSEAEASAGERQFRQCAACHSIEEGGKNKIGPALYGVVGREVASVDGFSYSTALQEYGGEWTYERLDCYLENPKECVPGNKMTFAGVKDKEDRADIIAYLQAQTPNPPSLPEPTEAASEGGSDASASDGQADEETDASSAPAEGDQAASASVEEPAAQN